LVHELFTWDIDISEMNYQGCSSVFVAWSYCFFVSRLLHWTEHFGLTIFLCSAVDIIGFTCCLGAFFGEVSKFYYICTCICSMKEELSTALTTLDHLLENFELVFDLGSISWL
jgi:hypothetical protein